MLESGPIEIFKSQFVYQRGISDCGVACLMSMIQLLGRNCHYETILKTSNCSIRGTNILGLQNAAKLYNFKVEAFRFISLNDLKNEATFPCILLIKKYFLLNHYVICCEKPKGSLTLVFDPSKGFRLWGREDFLKFWKLKIALIVK